MTISAYAIPGIKECYREYETPDVRAQRIIEKVCTFYNVNELLVRSKSRERTLVNARMFCMYFMRLNLNISLKKIGNTFNRDHTTVIHARDFIHGQIQSKGYNPIKEDYLKLTQII